MDIKEVKKRHGCFMDVKWLFRAFLLSYFGCFKQAPQTRELCSQEILKVMGNLKEYELNFKSTR